jgi:hypothetical protein
MTTTSSVAGFGRPDTLPRHRWWVRRSAPRPHDRPAEILAVLQRARGIVEAGWVQNRWAVAAPRPQAGPRAAGGPAAVRTTDPLAGACVVAAVALAVRERDARADLAVATGPAIAFLWDAVHGRDARFRRASGRSAPHEERVARMRELARWNDEPGRTRADVVGALDRAAADVVAATVDPVRA